MRKTLMFFRNSFLFSILGLAAGSWVGYLYSGTLEGALTALFLTFILSILEISLSFDNAVVNATVLENMSAFWRKMFIVWGIPIAVFGMRVVFPLAIVSIIAEINPIEAVKLATFEPDKYAEIMLSSHVALAGFGGAFLMMVALGYFVNHEKDTHWLSWIEKPLVKMGRIEAINLALSLLLFYVLTKFMTDSHQRMVFLESGIFGMITYVAVDGLASILKMPDATANSVKKTGGFAMFLYLEVLDASFSFDGVIGAFALTHNLYLIAIGLGIGALWVRSMTIYLVEKGTLTKYIFLEHGAFYAIGALALLMLFDVFVHIPEALTGLIGAVMIGWSLMASIQHDRPKRRKR